MSWHHSLSMGVVIALLILLIIFYFFALQNDRSALRERRIQRNRRSSENAARYQRAINDMKEDDYGNMIHVQQYYEIPASRRAEIREVVEDINLEKKNSELHVRKLITSSRDGMIFGLLAGAIIGGQDVAISGAFTWAIIRGVVTGLGFYI